LLGQVLSGNEVNGTSWRLKNAGQKIISVDAKLLPLHKGERIVGIGCILRDSSQREKAYQVFEKKTQALQKEVETTSARLSEVQQKLIMSEKMAVMGQLAAGVAHELRNPLNIVSTSIYYLQKVLPDQNDKVREHFTIIRSEIQRAQTIISNLLDFSQKSAQDRTEVDINALLEQTLALVNKELAVNDIVVKRAFSAVDRCYINPDDVKQVFLNLILNARDAMPQGGTLTISTRPRGDGFVLIEFTDSGVGIDKDVMDKIFDPFFSTKKTGDGVGIGLSIVHSAIERNKGTIEVKSKPGKGTTFSLHLPQAR